MLKEAALPSSPLHLPCNCSLIPTSPLSPRFKTEIGAYVDVLDVRRCMKRIINYGRINITRLLNRAGDHL